MDLGRSGSVVVRSAPCNGIFATALCKAPLRCLNAIQGVDSKGSSLRKKQRSGISYPIRNGIIENWEDMLLVRVQALPSTEAYFPVSQLLTTSSLTSVDLAPHRSAQ